jgi:dihydroxyacid dehydratase/phosphogluconate dehydratase
VRTGDWIILDVENRLVSVDVTPEEFDLRPPSAALTAALARPVRGWAKLYVDTVQGAETGADLDFLVGSSGDRVARESH